MTKTISLQDETYRKLSVALGKLQIKRKKPQSFDSTINYLLDAVNEEGKEEGDLQLQKIG